MKKDVLKLLSFTLCFIILLAAVPISFAAADNGLTLNVKFNYDEYIAGETVTVTVYLADAADEFDDGLILGGIGTNLCFSDNLEYNSYRTDFTTDNAGDICEVNYRKVQNKNILGINIASDAGVNIKNIYNTNLLGPVTDETEIQLMTVTFNIKDSNDSVFSVKFEEDNLGDASLAYGTDIFDVDENIIDCTIQSTSATAKLSPCDAIIRPVNAEYLEDEIIARVDAYVAREEGAVMFVKLYDTDTNMIVAPVKVLSLIQGDAWLDEPLKFTYSGDKTNIKVAYYIFDTKTSLKPIAEFKEIPLVEHQG